MTPISPSPATANPFGARSEGIVNAATQPDARGRKRTAAFVRSALAAAACALAVGVSAAPIQFDFGGTVDDDAIGGCGSVVVCGSLGVSLVFDGAAPDANPDPALGLYEAGAITLSIDGTVFFTATSGTINVSLLDSVHQYGLLALGDWDDGGGNTGSAELSILLQDFTHGAFATDALPLTPGALTLLLPGGFTLNASEDQFQLMGTVTSVVPEPATALLLALGLAACGLARRHASAAR